MTRCFRCQSALLTHSRDDEVVCIACGRCQNPVAPLPRLGVAKAPAPSLGRPCAFCATPFQGRDRRSKYCSVTCANRAKAPRQVGRRPAGADALTPLQLSGSVAQYARNDVTKRRASA